MSRFKKLFVGALALTLIAGPGVALADGGDPHHGDHHFEYQDADCTPADDANGDDSVQVVEEKEHDGNGRTECVLVDGDGTPVSDAACGGHDDDCYIAYDPYQEDTTPGNSPGDRGAAIRYHNGDKYAAGGGHGHGNYGCWNLGGASDEKNGEGTPGVFDAADAAEATAAEDELEARLNAEGERFTGPAGAARYAAEFWYFYPVGAAKTFHFVRTQEPTTPEGHTVVVAEAVEVFTSGMTDGQDEDDPADDGLEHFNAMFSLGNEGPVKDVYTDDTRTTLKAEYDKNGDNYIDNDVAGIDYKRVEEDHLPLWQGSDGKVCDLPWHPHTGAEGVATSFDAENPDRSAWMAHILLYANGGDIWGGYGGGDGSESHAQWKPLNHVPAACNPHGPCL